MSNKQLLFQDKLKLIEENKIDKIYVWYKSYEKLVKLCVKDVKIIYNFSSNYRNCILNKMIFIKDNKIIIKVLPKSSALSSQREKNLISYYSIYYSARKIMICNRNIIAFNLHHLCCPASIVKYYLRERNNQITFGYYIEGKLIGVKQILMNTTTYQLIDHDTKTSKKWFYQMIEKARLDYKVKRIIKNNP